MDGSRVAAGGGGPVMEVPLIRSHDEVSDELWSFLFRGPPDASLELLWYYIAKQIIQVGGRRERQGHRRGLYVVPENIRHLRAEEE
jgi:hypothetical protein